MSSRGSAVLEIQRRLQRQASPRLHMLALVSATATCGFLASVGLLELGVSAMVLRYPLAVGCAYAVFLGLVALWLRRYRLRASERRNGDGSAGSRFQFDVAEIPFDGMWSDELAPDAFPGFGGGGGFSGAGGGSSWGSGSGTSSFSSASGAGGGSGGGGGGGLDLDDGAVWLIPVAIVAAIALGMLLYVVYVAPVLFAELLLDAGLAAGLYRRLSGLERRPWLVTAVRGTVVPAALMAGLLALGGAIMQGVYPDAVSIGGVVRQVLLDSAERPDGR